MSCSSLTQGLAKGCKISGGVRRFLIANYENVTAVEGTVGTPAVPTGEIVTITMAGTPASKFYVFEPNSMSSDVKQNVQADTKSNSGGYEQVVTMAFGAAGLTARNTFNSFQDKYIVIAHTFADEYLMYGQFNGLELSGGGHQTGVALNEMNGYNITLTGYSPTLAKAVDPDIISALI